MTFFSRQSIFAVLCFITLFLFSLIHAEAADISGYEQKGVLHLTLDECLSIALENNRQRRVSRSAVAIAEEQHRQALSAYWPSVSLKVSAARMDEAPNFIFPSNVTNVMGVPVTIPEQDVKLMDRDSLISSAVFMYPLYTGGKRSAVVDQAVLGIQAAKEAVRRTDLQIVHDVKHMYYGLILATQLRELGEETYERLKAVLEMTEHLYKRGSERVRKTDYLRTKVIVTTVRSMLELLQSNEKLAQAALVNAIGLPWKTSIQPPGGEIPFLPLRADTGALVAEAYRFSPDWASLSFALKAAEAKIEEAKSGHYPVVGLTGNLTRIDNAYDKGMMTDRNRSSWTVGIGLELPLFAGFRTVHEVREARARLDKIKHEQVLFSEGIALQVTDAFLQMERSREQVETTRAALDTARENRELTTSAYQEELLETRDVIEAQLLESFMNAQYQRALFDHASGRARLDLIIGKELWKPGQGGSSVE